MKRKPFKVLSLLLVLTVIISTFSFTVSAQQTTKKTVEFDKKSLVVLKDGTGSFAIKNPVKKVTYTATAVDGTVLKVALNKTKTSGNYMYTVTGKKKGNTKIIVKGSDHSTSSFPVRVATGRIVLDTKQYTIEQGKVYDIGIKELKDAKLSDVKMKSSRDAIATVKKLPNGNCRVTAKRPGTCYVIFDVGNSHSSVQIKVESGKVTKASSSNRNICYFN